MADQPVKTFLESLPVVKPEDLPENSQTCHICKELYNSPDPEEVEKAESAVRLPCSHIMGSECLAKWFDGHNSCPLCRAILFSQNTPNLETLQTLTEDLMAVTRQWAGETHWNALSTAVADNISNTQELLTLSAETDVLFARLVALQATEETEESRAEISRIVSRNAEIDTLLQQLEARYQETGHQSGAAG